MWVAPKLTGGLGNRMFQYAAAAGAAEKWDREVVFYSPACQSNNHGPIGSIFRMFPHVRLVHEATSFVEYGEPPHWCYEYIPFDPEPDANVLTSGYRQSPKYFPKEVKPDWDSAVGSGALKWIETLAGLTVDQRHQTYAVHVRLGDFKELAHHQIDLTNYYRKAFERIPHGSRIHLFSDDPQLCRHLFMDYVAQMNLRFSFAVTSSDVESLYEMSLCLGGTICGNSTFSWWGAWFAHENGAAWATFPSSTGNGQPDPTNHYPEWATIVQV